MRLNAPVDSLVRRPRFGDLTLVVDPQSKSLTQVVLRDNRRSEVYVTPATHDLSVQFAISTHRGFGQESYEEVHLTPRPLMQVGRASLLQWPIFGPWGLLIHGFRGLADKGPAIKTQLDDVLSRAILPSWRQHPLERVKQWTRLRRARSAVKQQKAMVDHFMPMFQARVERPDTHPVKGTEVGLQLLPNRLYELIMRDIEPTASSKPCGPDQLSAQALFESHRQPWFESFRQQFHYAFLPIQQPDGAKVVYLPQQAVEAGEWDEFEGGGDDGLQGWDS